ncbi:glutamate cyclase domain-containing protein [Candidatus Bipolaricaulota bacterium]
MKSERDPFEEIDCAVAGSGFVDRQVTDYITDLQAAASVDQPLTHQIASHLISLRDGEVFLFTGFVVPDRYPQGENDGPLGAIALARALDRIGMKPTIWVDQQLLDTARWLAAELRVETPIRAIDLVELNRITNHPSAAIAIEKPGQNEKNTMHTFDGIAIESGSIPIDSLFVRWDEADVLTIGIGDRGNEIGFGTLRDQVVRLRPETATCRCGCGGGVVSSTRTQLFLPAAVSNWGAYGIAASLGILCDNEALLLKPHEEARLLQVAAVRGCVDGVRRRGGFGVDGISGQTSVAVVEELGRIATRVIKAGDNENACA